MGFEHGAVAVAVNLYGHQILTFAKIGGDVERGCVARVLRESHVSAVDVEVEERIHTVEIDQHLHALPIGWQVESAAIRTYLVAGLIGGPARRRCAHHAATPVIGTNRVLENHALVGVNRFAVLHRTILLEAGDIPIHRHFHFGPSRRVEFGMVEDCGPFRRIGRPVEKPFSVQTQPIMAVLGQYLAGGFDAFKVEEPGMGRQFVVA